MYLPIVNYNDRANFHAFMTMLDEPKYLNNIVLLPTNVYSMILYVP